MIKLRDIPNKNRFSVFNSVAAQSRLCAEPAASVASPARRHSQGGPHSGTTFFPAGVTGEYIEGLGSEVEVNSTPPPQECQGTERGTERCGH